MGNKAQGTTEYLVIIGIVVVLSLVVVGVLMDQVGSSATVSKSTSKIGTLTQSIGLTESLVDPVDGNFVVKLLNNSGGAITISNVKVGDVSVSFSEDVGQGGSKLFRVKTGVKCEQGKIVSNSVVVTYVTAEGLTKTQSFNDKIMFDCTPYNVTQANLANQCPTTSVCSQSSNSLNFNLIAVNNDTSVVLSDFNMDCNVNAYDRNNLNSFYSIDFNRGSYSCIFSKSGYYNKTASVVVPDLNYYVRISTPIVATGGTIVYLDSTGSNPRSSPAYVGGYTVHTFTSSGTFTVTSGTGDVNYLIVAGGGAGGRTTSTYIQRGSGGGAGGLIQGSTTVSANSYTINVGAGGTYNGGTIVTSGQDSNALGFNAIGGGKGGTTDGEIGANGGSGGGSWYAASGHSLGTVGQGNDGGKGTQTANYGGGGGGGAGAVGGDGTSTIGGAGGNGIQSDINGTLMYYAGGGSTDLFGAVGHNAGAAGLGGGGIGDNRGGAYYGTAGTPNTGGGGGSGGGAGGSGVVIIRYFS